MDKFKKIGGYQFVEFNRTARLAYTKSSEGIDQLPPTTIRMEYRPCSNQFEHSVGPVVYTSDLEVLKHSCSYNT